MPEGQRQLISLVLWKLLASSSRAIAGALDTMTKRLQGVLAESTTQNLVETLDEDYESLDETAEEWEEENESNILTADEYQTLPMKLKELKHFKTTCRKHPRRRKKPCIIDRTFHSLC